MPNHSPTASFVATVAAFGNNTGIVVPTEVLDQLDAGERPPVDVDLNGYAYRSTIGAIKGQALISVSAAVRKASGLVAGDAVQVTLVVNKTARSVHIPDDLAAALRAKPETETFFADLSNSLQRYHIDQIEGAKTDETRQRRIEKAVGLFLTGKKR